MITANTYTDAFTQAVKEAERTHGKANTLHAHIYDSTRYAFEVQDGGWLVLPDLRRIQVKVDPFLSEGQLYVEVGSQLVPKTFTIAHSQSPQPQQAPKRPQAKANITDDVDWICDQLAAAGQWVARPGHLCCECGAEKCNTTHSTWCPKYGARCGR